MESPAATRGYWLCSTSDGLARAAFWAGKYAATPAAATRRSRRPPQKLDTVDRCDAEQDRLHSLGCDARENETRSDAYGRDSQRAADDHADNRGPVAPRATRMPISWVRCSTANDTAA